MPMIAHARRAVRTLPAVACLPVVTLALGLVLDSGRRWLC
jgi:hypothetical protein